MSKNRFTLKEFKLTGNNGWREKLEERCEERYKKGKHYLLSSSHRDGCFMCEHSSGLDPEGFIMYDGIEYRDALGRKRKSGQMWYRFRCNDADCRAVLLVRWDEFARLLTSGYRAKEEDHEETEQRMLRNG